MVTQEKEEHNTARLSIDFEKKEVEARNGASASIGLETSFSQFVKEQEALDEAFKRETERLCKEHECEVWELPQILPRLVTRGPHSPDDTPLPLLDKNTKKSVNKTKIDTFRMTAEESVSILQQLIELSCPGVIFLPRKSGVNGYVRGFNIVLNGMDLGTLCYGAPHNEAQNLRPQLDIGGNGKCDKINWEIFHHYFMLLKKPAIKQIHICLDMYYGELTIEEIIEAHKQLKFQAKKANRNPRITPYGSLQPDGSNPGRSLYIGSMQSSKFIRFYEKAYEVFKGLLNKTVDNYQTLAIKNYIKTGEAVQVEGFNDDEPFDLTKWMRAEIELKDGNCLLSPDMLLNTDLYFAGAYPFCEELLDMTDGKRPQRMMNNEDLDLEVRIENMKGIAGSLIDDLIYLGYTNDEIVSRLKGGKGASQKLIRSGRLLK